MNEVEEDTGIWILYKTCYDTFKKAEVVKSVLLRKIWLSQEH
jgi:hypothetical protein